MKIAIIGATGMVGHILFHELQKRNIDVVGIGRRKVKENIMKFDLCTDWNRVKYFLCNGKFDIIINCSAILVKDCNINKQQAVYINSLFPHSLVNLFEKSNTKIVHLSTGGVFSGNDEYYFENSPLSPQTYYGITKAAGEFSNNKDLIIRSDFWGPDNKKNGTGLFNWFLNQEGAVTAYTNVFFNGISNIELARIVLHVIDHNNIIHIGTAKKISKGDLLKIFKEVFNYEKVTLLYNNTIYKNVILKSRETLPYINDFYSMVKNTRQYLIDNKQYYADIYSQIF
jgi:dTDP-4-dehydrorhamnose reductase